MPTGILYLASASPRRSALLAQIGVPFQLLAVSIDESIDAGEAPLDYVQRVSAAKASAGMLALAPRTDASVLAADTVVVLDHMILRKPVDAADGRRMLARLSGRTHEVLTAITLAGSSGAQTRVSRSEVTFRPIGEGEARNYWDTGEPEDKAGGYAIQGLAAVFVEDLKGSYSGVMGLPLYETAQLLDLAGVDRWQSLSGPGGGDHGR